MFQHSRRFLGTLVFLALACCGSLTDAADDIDFNRDIRPIVSGVCVACHGPDESAREAGLRLDTFEGATTDLGGYSAIVPSDAANSELLSRVTTDDLDLKMPPPGKGRALTAEEIDLLRRWIDSGAKYEVHWSYQPPVRSDIPIVDNGNWPRNEIDYFILDKLQREGLQPSAEADRHILARRVSLALTGLPPSQEEVSDFVEDSAADAYERYVDAQLRKPAFGERWARVWLDLARYADSAGYADDPARTIWAYRDYVIKSLNENKPFDQFTIEQLAGDILDSPTDEQLIATAFHRNTMTNNEGGTNDEQFRNEAIVDRVNTTFAVWMGTTMACAQCHTHKYDPITQEEYFQVFDIFNQTQDADRRDESPLLEIWGDQLEAKKASLKQRIASLKAKLNATTPELETAFIDWHEKLTSEPEWIKLQPGKAASDNGKLLSDSNGVVRLDGERPDKATYTIELPITESTELSAIRLSVTEQQKTNFVLSRLSARYVPSEPSPVAARYVRLSVPGKQKFLHIAEVQVFEDGINIASGASATQSSTDFGGEAARATDGNTDGDYNKNSVTHTASEDSPWLQVDLGRTAKVDSVIVWNRTDGGAAIQNRIQGYEIELLDEQKQVVAKIVPDAVPEPSYAANLSGTRELNIAAAIADYEQSGFPASASIINDQPASQKPASDKGWAIGGATGAQHDLTLFLSNSTQLSPGALVVELQQVSKFGQHVLTDFSFSITADANAADWASMPVDIRQLVSKDVLNDQQQEKLFQFYKSISPILEPIRKQLTDTEKQLADLKPETTVPIMRQLASDKGRETFVQLRGNYQSLGKQVAAGVPSAFHAIESSKSIDRLDFARWLVDNKNPLTARVVVNRHWEQLFGTGIVETSEEFGAQGELPTHPKLLDHLALSLMDSGWDIKKLLKQIVMSATYRQSSVTTEAALLSDPDNRLYSRGPRFRIPAEMVRDQALAVSGLLSDNMYGPPVRPPQPQLGLNAAFGSGTDWQTSSGEDRYRRGIYTTWRRSNPYPSMATFDAPNREVCTLRRSRTNTPLQALVTMNDPVYVEAAQALARKMDQVATLEEKIQLGVKLCLYRQATNAETERLTDLYQQLLNEFAALPEEAKKVAEVPLGPIPEGSNGEGPAVEHLAALTVVANVLLNLDEFLMPR